MTESSDTLNQVKQTMLENRGYRTLKLRDNLTRIGIVTGDITVVFTVVLIFFYLISVVLSVFESAEVAPLTRVDNGKYKESIVYFTTEKYGEIVLSIDSSGENIFHYLPF